MNGFEIRNTAFGAVPVNLNGPDWWRTCEVCHRIFLTRSQLKRHEKARRQQGRCTKSPTDK